MRPLRPPFCRRRPLLHKERKSAAESPVALRAPKQAFFRPSAGRRSVPSSAQRTGLESREAAGCARKAAPLISCPRRPRPGRSPAGKGDWGRRSHRQKARRRETGRFRRIGLARSPFAQGPCFPQHGPGLEVPVAAPFRSFLDRINGAALFTAQSRHFGIGFCASPAARARVKTVGAAVRIRGA